MLLDYVFLSNTVKQYLIFLIIIIIGIFISKIFSYLSGSFFTNLAKKTKTKIDDIFFNVLKRPLPIQVVIIVIFINLAFNILYVSSSLKKFIFHLSYIIYVSCVAWFFIKFFLGIIKVYLERYASKTKTKYDDQLIPILKTLTKVIFITLAVLLILSNFGYNISALLAGLGIGGLAVALAAKDILENMLGGIAIFAEKPFNVGDAVRSGNIVGSIKEIGIRSTKIQTYDGTLVVVPNSKLSKEAVENISKRKARKEKMVLGLTYDTSSTKLIKAKKIIKEIFTENKDIDKNFHITFDKFDAYSLNISIVYWITQLDYAKYLKVKDKVNMEIKKRFEKENIEFAFPTQTIELKK